MREIQVMKNQRERRPNERGLLKHHVHIMTACMLSFAIVPFLNILLYDITINWMQYCMQYVIHIVR